VIFSFHAVTLCERTLSEHEAGQFLRSPAHIFPSSLLKVAHAIISANWRKIIFLLKLRQPEMRILIVEDEPDLLRSIAQALREEGYAVDTAADGEDGFYKAESYDYDAIVLDVMLPKMDGWQILKRLRKIKKTPVLMLTARDQSRDRVKGLDTGADDYVVKPFDLPELFARLRALIRRSANKTTNVIEIGDVKIDTALRNILLKEKSVELTAREYALVEFLALHRGEVVTRTQLYEHLFDENESSLSNLLDVHVSNVRKKLGAEFIVTRRGHGYCIE
jgi:two-component system OmpR family response regulator